MLLIEYRIKLPLPLDQYQIAQLYTTVEMSKEFTSSGEGVEILENIPCDPACLPNHTGPSRKAVTKVQRTLKRYYIPSAMSAAVGLSDCILRESSFNGFPNLRTVVTAEAGTDGEFTIDTVCKKMDDPKDNANVFKLPQAILDKCSVVDIDIVNDSLPPDLLNKDDPKEVGLKDDWQESLIPRLSMVVYKLVFVKSRETNKETKETKEAVNTLVMDSMRKVFTVFHRKLVCSQDMWKGLNMEDIRTIEQETKDVLDRKRSDDVTYFHE